MFSRAPRASWSCRSSARGCPAASRWSRTPATCSTDSAGVALALVTITLAARPPTARSTFGLARAEILAAAVNAAVLLGLGA
ncbi:cation transporter [Lentzea terrae]|uniref:cation transporter n=1 Tax=Lentzea terrae TaxID=2200761 RepID=UPI0038CC0EE1